jgi:2-dehydropantoate 2-reductase
VQILVIGAGAVGGYFGGRLAEAKRDVTFLVHAKRAQEIKADGLQIISPHGDLRLQPKTVTADEITRPYDVILLGVKSYALSGAMDDFAAAVGPETMIVPVLNGMRHIDLLVARFGERAVLGGVCLVATEIDGEGRILQLAGFQKLIYGELDGRSTPRLGELDGTFRGAGFDTVTSSHIVQDMWEKWVQIATLGALTCLLRGNIGEIVSIPGGADLCRAVLRECSDIAGACGHPPSSTFLEKQTRSLTEDSQLTSSMYRDLTKGAPVEADTVPGDLLERGGKFGLTTPLLQAAFVNLSIYQRGRERTKSWTGRDAGRPSTQQLL